MQETLRGVVYKLSERVMPPEPKNPNNGEYV